LLDCAAGRTEARASFLHESSVRDRLVNPEGRKHLITSGVLRQYDRNMVVGQIAEEIQRYVSDQGMPEIELGRRMRGLAPRQSAGELDNAVMIEADQAPPITQSDALLVNPS
jgi:hypothetical protein